MSINKLLEALSKHPQHREWVDSTLRAQAENIGKKAQAKLGVQRAIGEFGTALNTMSYADKLKIGQGLLAIRQLSQSQTGH